jgi:nucleoside-diphosphate-sugar epimerase
MNVLVTGGGGFIGSHLVESQLNQGNFVRTVDLQFTNLGHIRNNPDLELIQGDITDKKHLDSLMESIDIVYHLASAHLDVNLTDAYYERVNVDATQNLILTAHQTGVKRFIHCSSVGVIGDVRHPPADEETTCNPTNVYEKTKLEGEKAALAYHQQTGFPVVIVRPAWVYGPRCPRTKKVIRMVKKGRFIFFGDGKNLRHPIYYKDCIQGIELAAQQTGIDGQVFILGGDHPVTTSELVNKVAEALGESVPTLHLPLWLGKMVGQVLQTSFGLLQKQPPFSERSLDFFIKNNAYSIEKARRELNFEPIIDLSTGLADTIQMDYKS